MSDRWSRIVVAALLVAHLVLLSRQPATSGSRLESWLLGVIGPVARAGSATVESADDLAGSWRSAGELRAENARMREELDTMRQTLVRLQAAEEELRRLSRSSSYTPTTGGESFVADVVFADTRAGLRTLVIHTGEADAEVDQTVVTDRGLVGRVVAASGRYAKVLPVTDPVSSVSAMIRRTRRQGLVRGAGVDPRGDRARLLLENVPRRSDVRVGDEVLSAGLDGVYQRGLPIGTVEKVDPDDAGLDDLFLSIEVAPAVDFGLLDQVFVLIQDPLPDTVRDDLLDERRVPSDDSGDP